MTDRVLSREQVDFFHREGYLALPGLIDSTWIEKLKTALAILIDRSRELAESDGTFDLEDGHSADSPRLRRIAYLDDLDPLFWEFSRDSILPDVVADLVGPDVTFRESLANFKWADGGREVKWHQDIPFYPHTNLTPMQVLIALEDVTPENGPLQVIPRSHRGPIFDHYTPDGTWTGFIDESDYDSISLDTAQPLTGPAGTVTIHHCATVHGSDRNDSPNGRPVLIVGYNAADALPYTAPAYPGSHMGTIVRGKPPTHARHDPVTMRLPPDWSGGYTSIFDHQDERD